MRRIYHPNDVGVLKDADGIVLGYAIDLDPVTYVITAGEDYYPREATTDWKTITEDPRAARAAFEAMVEIGRSGAYVDGWCQYNWVYLIEVGGHGSRVLLRWDDHPDPGVIHVLPEVRE